MGRIVIYPDRVELSPNMMDDDMRFNICSVTNLFFSSNTSDNKTQQTYFLEFSKPLCSSLRGVAS